MNRKSGKCQKVVINVTVFFSDILKLPICPVASSNPKHIECNIYDKEKQQILIFERLEMSNVWHFCLKTTDFQSY